MKTAWKTLILVAVILLVGSCGYRNPNVYSGPHKTIYLREWNNRTSELNLDSEIYRSLTKWFQNSSSISTVRQKAGSDLILAGEIISIELPSLSYGANNLTTEVKVRLRVRYIVKDLASKKILLEVADETWTEEYIVSGDAAQNQNNEAAALDTIIDDLSQQIYQRTIAELPKL